jgi:hypothetical protein
MVVLLQKWDTPKAARIGPPPESPLAPPPFQIHRQQCSPSFQFIVQLLLIVVWMDGSFPIPPPPIHSSSGTLNLRLQLCSTAKNATKQMNGSHTKKLSFSKKMCS